jgi:Domain of unknown function (DUF4157)
MSNRSPATITTKEKSSVIPMRSSLLQRKCACGNSAGMAGECSDCQNKSLVQRKSINQDNTSEVSPIAHEFPIQTKLTVGKPGDIYEQEADRVAAQVMSMGNSSPSIQPARAMGKKEVQTKRSSDGESQAGSNIESQLSSSKGGGSPLPDGVRSFMEPRFGADFSRVRVHTDNEAIQMNRELNAQAFTHQQDIYFSAGKTPSTNSLTAHELTHVVQQTGVVQTKTNESGIKINHKGFAIVQQVPAVSPPACKNQTAVDQIIAQNPRQYSASVTMFTHVIQKGDTLEKLALNSMSNNNVFVFGHYLDEIIKINKGLKTGSIGNCAILLQGWSDPAIGSLRVQPPVSNQLSPEVQRVIAVVYSEQTGTSSSAQEQQKYIWFSIRLRLVLGMHGASLDNVINKGGYFGKGTKDYNVALKDLALATPKLSGVINAKDIVLNNWSTSIPNDAGPYYFHWRLNSTPEGCFGHPKVASMIDKEKECAWKYAKANGFAKVPKSQGWFNKIYGDKASPDDRLGSMYIYPF